MGCNVIFLSARQRSSFLVCSILLFLTHTCTDILIWLLSYDKAFSYYLFKKGNQMEKVSSTFSFPFLVLVLVCPLLWNTKSACWLHVITVHPAFLLGFPYLTWYPRSVLRHLWPQGVLRHLWPLNRVEHTVCQVPCSDLFAVSPLFTPGLGDSTKFRVSKHHLYANDSQIYISRWATSSWITALYIHLPTQYLHLTSLKQPPQFYPQTCSSWRQLHPSSCLDQIPGSSLSPFFLLLPRSNPLAIPVGSV